MSTMNPYAPPAAPIAPPPHQGMTPGPSQPRPISPLEAVRFVFEDPEWKQNMMMGTVLMLIPIVGPIVFGGFMCEMHQRLVRRHPRPMPKFDFGDFTHYLSRGLMPFLVNFLMMLPLMIIVYGMIFGIVFGAMAADAAAHEPLITIAVAVGGGLISMVIWFSMAAILNAGMTRAELTEDFGRSMSLGPLFDYTRSTFTRFVFKTIVFSFIGIGIVILGMLACYIGLYPAIYVLQVAGMHMRWQLYDDHVGRGGDPIELKPPQWLPSELQRMGPQPVPVGRG
jgi:hypothetical protein